MVRKKLKYLYLNYCCNYYCDIETGPDIIPVSVLYKKIIIRHYMYQSMHVSIGRFTHVSK